MAERGQSTESQIRELKVTGHTMALEPGMYCVYNAPGGPASGQNGLPGVRITAAPGTHIGQVTVASFTPDGWIGSDSAALVQVINGTAQLLVTVYQAHDSEAEAPQLQVVRLSGETAATPVEKPVAQQQAPAPGPAAPDEIQVVAHIYGRGDVAGRLGEWMGEAGSQRWIEGFGLAPGNGIAPGDVEYQAVLGRGWLSPWSEGGQFCGSRGMSLPILGVRVRLKGAAAKTHRVVLSASFVDGTQVGPVGDGEACEAPSLAALEAFQVALVPIAGKAASRGNPAAVAHAAPAPKPKRAKAVEKPVPAPVRASAKPALKPGRKPAAEASAVPVAPAKPGRKPMAVSTKPVAAPVTRSSAKPAAVKTAAPKAVAPKTAAPKAATAKASAAKAPAAKAATPKAAATKAAPPKLASMPVGRAAAKRTPPTTRRR